MDIIEKIIKVLDASKKAAWYRMEQYAGHGETEKAAHEFGEWLAYDRALTMLTHEAEAERYFKIWFPEDAANVEM